jgi:hypothetical protein
MELKNAVEFGGAEATEPEDAVYLYMREPRVLGKEGRFPGITYFYVTKAEAARIVKDIEDKLT